MQAGDPVELDDRIADDLVAAPGIDGARDSVHQQHGGCRSDGMFGASGIGKVMPELVYKSTGMVGKIATFDDLGQVFNFFLPIFLDHIPAPFDISEFDNSGGEAPH